MADGACRVESYGGQDRGWGGFLYTIDDNLSGKKNSGFTFIELVVVILVISIFAIVISPIFNSSSKEVGNGAVAVAYDISTARMEAMLGNRALSVDFISGGSSYLFGNGQSRELMEIGQRLSVITSGPVTFNSLGEPLGMTSRRTVTVTDGVSSRDIFIEPYTGKVTLP